jgi:ribosomal protein S18 acetylase RimI-like enzyme
MGEELVVSPMAETDTEAIVALWQRCDLTRPWNDPTADIALARRGPNSTVLVGRCGGALVATTMVGHDGHRGWVYYVAVDAPMRGRGFGRTIMTAAEAWLRERGILKAMLMTRTENAAVCEFYHRLGYADQPRAVFAKWLDGRSSTP